MSSDVPLLPVGTIPPSAYSASPVRWYILCVASLLSLNQSATWFTFSSVNPNTIHDFFGARLNEDALGLLLNWGPILGVFSAPLQFWLSSRKNGLHLSIVLAAWLVFAGNVIRTVPLFLGATFRQNAFAFYLYQTGQILNAIAGPLVMGTVTQLSVLWFPESERVLATSVFQTSNGMGTAVGFLAGPVWFKGSISSLFVFGVVLGAIPAFCVCCYFPAKPTTAPNAAAAAADTTASKFQDSTTPRAPYFILVVSTGILTGVYYGWQGLLQEILSPAGVSEDSVGWIGFSNSLAANLSCILAGRMVDLFFARRLKTAIVVGYAVFLMSLCVFTFSLPCFLFDDPPFDMTNNVPGLVGLLFISGMSQGAISPLIYELAAELLYPVSEGLSGGILVLILNGACFATIFLKDYLDANVMNFAMTCFIFVVTLVVLLFVKETYRRPLG
ncbi:hypothetical protein TrVE_jg5517 [Triparma verrucosa]|uniref:Major facilitator superfamily (MFS) profile domain-containing protein n=1 Tax=Triparma verrucosa TaxID=1606542 RepID=A0A9W7BPV1_9STRA|nr:hypothetical protein TrVE_jg5517 [Triparma verrucosa]